MHILYKRIRGSGKKRSWARLKISSKQKSYEGGTVTMMIMTQYNTLVNLANMESLHLQGSKILATPTTKDYTIALGDYVDDCRAGEVLREIAGNYEIEESVYYMPEE